MRIIGNFGELTENGTCTNGKIVTGNETRILNQTAAEYLKNLSANNRVMAEMVCHTLLNEIRRKINKQS